LQVAKESVAKNVKFSETLA